MNERLSAEVREANFRSVAALSRARMMYDDISRPPSPVRDCAACADLAILRDEARARHDGSAETDANVLLRRHQRRYHAALLGIPDDAEAETEYETSCTDCLAGSGPRQHPADVEEWQRRHARDTGHARYRRARVEYMVANRPEGDGRRLA
ncbi:DUF7848 domain-containing protein [Streptomyces sp. NPDC002920]